MTHSRRRTFSQDPTEGVAVIIPTVVNEASTLAMSIGLVAAIQVLALEFRVRCPETSPGAPDTERMTRVPPLLESAQA
jgi:hypothetical protein